jgi:2-(1,2-epoxy-1,2-dihydrophenyl)acetyl-CoA isomerase
VTSDQLLFDVREGVATLTLNRPELLNALSPEMTDALIDTTQECERNSSIRCVVLRGAGRAFMAGGDVKGMHAALSAGAEAQARRMEMRVIRAHQFITQIVRMPKPVIAAVHGAVAGIGFGIALSADIVIARDDTFFMAAYRHIGLTADGGLTYFVPRMIGERKALELSLFGERLPACEALRLGLLNWVVAAPEFDAFVQEKVRLVAEGPTLALGEMKRLIRGSLDCSWDEQSRREAQSIVAVGTSQDHVEGVAAFVGKRPPRFSGC